MKQTAISILTTPPRRRYLLGSLSLSFLAPRSTAFAFRATHHAGLRQSLHRPRFLPPSTALPPLSLSPLTVQAPTYVRSFSSTALAATPAPEPEQEEEEMFPNFDDVPGLHPTLVANLKAKKFQTMTEIQAGTWEAAAAGRDVLGRARTGTGKTIAFLLPALQQLLNKGPANLPRDTIHMLILSPTRELAAQIDDEAQKLTGGSKSITHQVMFGGASKPKDISMLERRLPTILVATPGRLRDHLDNTNIRGRSFREALRQTSILVLDETDRLLDMGFQKEVNEIIRFLPAKQNRQTLLFSATVPQEVKAVMAATMKNDFVTVDCIHDKDPGSHTNKQVEQKHVILPYQTRLVTGTVEILSKLIANAKANKEPLKMVVFFNTANLVAYYAALFNEGLGIPVYELHSRKSQSFRTKTADKFRAAAAAILFTSDVSARGVDYPGVTNVVQVGIADSRESYIHRLGRTGRAGKVGEGLLVLADVERNFLNQLSGMDIPVHAEFQTALENAPDAVMMQKLQPIMNEIYNDDESPLAKNLQNAYRSMLGFYNGKLSKLGVKNPDTLIEFVNSFAMQGGCAQLPGIEKKTIGKMGLRTTTGLNITANLPRQGQGGGGRGGNRGGGGGGGGRGSGGGRGAAPKRQMSTASTPEAKKPKAAGDRRRRGGGGRGNRTAAAN